MSDETDNTSTGPTSGTGSAPGTPPGPQPEPIRFFGTTWVEHDGGYGWRRVGVAVGSLVLAFVGAFLLRFGYQGLEIAAVGGLVNLLVVLMFAVCSAVAFRKTWEGYSGRPDPHRHQQLRSLLTIGFIGALLAYFLRTFAEAPGEKLRRAEYETAREQFVRRSSRRTGNPMKKKRKN